MVELSSIPPQFELGGDDISALSPLGVGHINDTFVANVRGSSSCIFQRINQKIFPDVGALMDNVQRVTEHLQRRGVRTLTIVPTVDGDTFYRDPDGECWRAFPFIEGTVSASIVSSPAQAQQAAYAYGEFARQLSDLPPPRLHETIPDFHNTPKRFADFLAAAEADTENRAAAAKAEIDAALPGADWLGMIAAAQTSGAVPERIAHNDAKIENALFDAETMRVVCVVDLDTVMPGTPLHDFGDLVRSAAATAAEDESDLRQVGVSMEIFAALAAGFVSACGTVMTEAERELLPIAGKLIAYEQALRFLTDYLRGDPYYRTRRPGHNLDRTRNQQRLVALLVSREEEMAEICKRSTAAASQ